MFNLRFDKNTPIYEQLMNHIKEMIIKQVMLPDEKMPSVREMARELTLNPNTIQKVYRELEHQGYLYSVPGKGNYVKRVEEKENNQYINSLYEELKQVVGELLHMNETKESIQTYISEIDDEIQEGR